MRRKCSCVCIWNTCYASTLGNILEIKTRLLSWFPLEGGSFSCSTPAELQTLVAMTLPWSYEAKFEQMDSQTLVRTLLSVPSLNTFPVDLRAWAVYAAPHYFTLGLVLSVSMCTFCFSWSPFGGLEATYAVHRLIGNIVRDFVFVIIELFSLNAFVLSQSTLLTDRQTDRKATTIARSSRLRCALIEQNKTSSLYKGSGQLYTCSFNL